MFGIVSGRDILPTTGPNSKGVKTFLEKQCLAHSKIILSIEPSQLPHVRNEENPSVIWQNLTRIHRACGLGVLLTFLMDFLKMSMPPGSTIASYVASICHAAYCLEECFHAEEKDSISISSTTSLIISDLDMISFLLNGPLPSYQSVIVNITGRSGTPLASLTFEDIVTRLMNEEGRLRNVVQVSNSATLGQGNLSVPQCTMVGSKQGDWSSLRRRLHADCPATDGILSNLSTLICSLIYDLPNLSTIQSV